MLLEKIFAIYSEENDTTFIMKESFRPDNGVDSRSVIGWHFGKPGENTHDYINKLTHKY